MSITDIPVNVCKNFFVFCRLLAKTANVKTPNIGDNLSNFCYIVERNAFTNIQGAGSNWTVAQWCNFLVLVVSNEKEQLILNNWTAQSGDERFFLKCKVKVSLFVFITDQRVIC